MRSFRQLIRVGFLVASLCLPGEVLNSDNGAVRIADGLVGDVTELRAHNSVQGPSHRVDVIQPHDPARHRL